MPKQQVALNKFEGGLHTDADPRDIAGNAFSALQGFSVDSLGIIKTMGTHGTHGTIGAVATVAGMNPGYGMFAFSSDYDDAGGLVSTNYLALNEGSYVHIYDDGGDAFNGMGNVDSTDGFGLKASSNAANETTQKLSFYAPNGDLRVSDGYFATHANLVKWLGYITKRTYGEGTSTDYPTAFAQTDVGFGTTPSDGWLLADASVEAGLTSANLKMINLGSKTKGMVEGDATGTAFITTVDGNAVTVIHSGADYGNFTSSGYGDDYYNGMTCSAGLTDGTTVYGVVYDYNHDFDVSDDGTETTHSTFYVWCGVNGDVTAEDAGIATNSSFQVGQSDGYHWKSDYTLGAHTRGVIGAQDFGVTLAFNEGDSGDGNWMPESTTRYKFYHTTTFDASSLKNFLSSI